MNRRLTAVEEMAGELKRTNKLLEFVVLGDPANKIPGQTQLNKELFERLNSVDKKITFFHGAAAIGAVVTPVLLGFILYQLA